MTMKKAMIWLLLLIPMVGWAAKSDLKPRLVVCTDIAPADVEPDDMESMVRLMAEGLSSKQRLVFTLCQLEGLPSSEVEQITGMNARQVKSNLYAARQTIRKRLKGLGYDED